MLQFLQLKHHWKGYYVKTLIVNTSYPMDSCFTGRRDRSRQTPEKDVLYIIPAGPVSTQ